MKNKPYSKKGQLVSNIVKIIMGAILIGIGIWLLYAYLIHDAGDNLNTAKSCGVVSIGMGSCKETCEDDEVPYKGVGCDGVEGTCCISTTKNSKDVILPGSYGGNSEHNFEVKYIGTTKDSSNVKDIGQCVFDNEYLTSLKCLSGLEVNIPIKIGVNNYGKNPVSAFARPLLVYNDNPDKMTAGDEKIEKTIPVGYEANPEHEVYITIKISSDNAVTNGYYKIYPYVLCETTECKSTDPRNRGIQKKYPDDSRYILVKFVEQI